MSDTTDAIIAAALASASAAFLLGGVYGINHGQERMCATACAERGIERFVVEDDKCLCLKEAPDAE